MATRIHVIAQPLNSNLCPTLRAARRKLSERFHDERPNAEVDVTTHLDHKIGHALGDAVRLRNQAEQFAAEAHVATKQAARLMTQDPRVGIRDAAFLLNLSPARVHQLLQEPD